MFRGTPVSPIDAWVMRMHFKHSRTFILSAIFAAWSAHNAAKYGMLDGLQNYPPME